MPTPPDFDQVCSDFRRFRTMIDKTIANSQGSAARDQLQRVATHLDDNFAKFVEEYPQAMKKLDDDRTRVEQKLSGTRQKLAETKAEVARAEAAQKRAQAASKTAATAEAPKVPKAAKPAAAIDPELGPNLRDELLGRFNGILEPGQPDFAPPIREVWEDWDVD